MTDLSATIGVTDRPSGTGAARHLVSERPALERISDFLARQTPATPCLVLDLATVRDRYAGLRSALPDARIHYAVKANPEPQVVEELAALGASFDVASPGEIDLCLARGASPESISYGNTIKKRSDIARAHDRGVRLFVTDSEPDLDNIAAAAPGARVFCRIAVDNKGSRTPFGRKFGCPPETAVRLLHRARQLGLEPYGVSFHIGSQQLDPGAWEHGIAAAHEVFEGLAGYGITMRMVNLGGGLPAAYTQPVPPLREYATRIEEALDRYFGSDRPELLIEPGRHLVGDAGVLRGEVVLATPETGSERRWVYLDIGRYNGLAETEGEAITYRLRTSRDGDPTGPVVLAGPTCDGDDVLYESTGYELPMTLRAGDWVDLLSAGAYTASYSSVGFNGFAPLPTYCLDGDERTERS
ncbi:ornithine decarboxylase [Halopolyspora algeriensis]|uniref:ornithine decarboxylase n=1 Tax=Halopolyspora algeriensis TaxID=1500506 RepID=A0A368VMI9_9ACTN|nr:type III PLP-dependent enzyme [Halopolyspora algeriensis]RCW42931.1 ornithine decarboxylase [Halopolyspora algeriensis]TQM56600.1 ornithine decarboxylase [Halopolyspora algeriensis]